MTYMKIWETKNKVCLTMIKLIHLLVINGKYSYIYDAYPNFLNKKNNILIFLNFCAFAKSQYFFLQVQYQSWWQ